MNKSTPISQLPSQSSATQTAFINDQQRQMITQAQNAISNSTLPMNTQISNDVIQEDDAAIQDMLNNLSPQHESPAPMQPQFPPQTTQEELLRIAAMNNLNVHQLNTLMSGYGPSTQTSEPPPSRYAQQISSILNSEIKIAGIVFFAVIAVHFLPISRVVGRYVALEKIPYHDVLLRAILASLAVVVVSSLVKV